MKELIIPLNTKSKTPIYEQICDYIKGEIQKKRLKPGDKLPSSRALAAYLAVSRSTVALSYDQLTAEGYIEAVPCKGYYICEIDGLYFPKRIEGERRRDSKNKGGKSEDIGNGSVKSREAENRSAENRSAENRSAENRNVEHRNIENRNAENRGIENRNAEFENPCLFDFALNGIAPGGFPHNAWKKLSRQVLQEEDDTLFQLGNPCGEEGIRSAVADYLYQARGVRCSADQIIIGAGNDYLLMLLGTILGRNKKVAMENPTYITAYYDFCHIGYEILPVGQDESGMNVEELQKTGADIAYVMPSHQFPVGTVMPLKRRMALLGWASQGENRYIIEDDYDSEFRYKGKPVPALQGFDRSGCVIYMGTFSKSVAPSIRISYMVLPKRLMTGYLKRQNPFSVTVSRADQRILELFIKEGYYGRHLNRMRAVYKSKHDLMVKCLKEMEEICTFSGENAGVHMVVEFHNGLTEKEAVIRAAEAGIKVYGISDYRISESTEGENKVLLGYACMKEEEIEKGMKALRRVWGTA